MGNDLELLARAVQEGRLLSVSEAAKLLGRSRQNVLQWVHKGKLSHVKFGGRIYIEREALEQVVHRVDVTTPDVG